MLPPGSAAIWKNGSVRIAASSPVRVPYTPGSSSAGATSIETVEGLADGDELNRLQQAFSANHALQCGYCTPGMLMSATALLRSNPQPTEAEIRKAIQGNICRCTGYWNIVEAVQEASSQ
jgi:aerobic-type carbon monoxide dehydrogenase small subunit (CoxS/CutS family)